MPWRLPRSPRGTAWRSVGLVALLGAALSSCDDAGDTAPSAQDASVPDPCAARECSGHGSCVVQGGAAGCACDSGYVAADCSECADGYYSHGNSCVDAIRFALPMANPNGSMNKPPPIGFDNDPNPGATPLACTSYAGEGFPHCYDGHTGTDFMLQGGFETMDAGSTAVLAAAAGEVVEAHDGEFDRCQADAATLTVVCPGYPEVTPPNKVTLRHVDGQQTEYLHLKKGSVLVSVGDWVECGAELARVGSSGNSSAPHLHFTLLDALANRIDPFGGPASHPESYWVEQDGPNGLPGAACQ